jgi:hypothetical protein
MTLLLALMEVELMANRRRKVKKLRGTFVAV